MSKIFRIIPVLLVLFMVQVSPSSANQPDPKILNIYNWEDYLGNTTIKDFEKKYGIKVNLRTYKSEDEMLASIQSNPAKYDLFVLSGNMVRQMVSLKLLSPVRFENIPNFQNIDSMFRNPIYDPGNRYSVPYLWGTTGIAVNKKLVKEKVDSWKALFNPRFRGKMVMLEDMDEVIATALKSRGMSINTNNTGELEEARGLLVKQKPLIKGYYDPIKIRTGLISENIWLAHEYSGEARFAADKNKNIEYVIPKEGAPIWVDNICIPRDSKNKAAAELFINFILDPKVSAAIANYLWYANCNKAAAKFTSKEILNDPSVYPPPAILKKCEFFKETGSDTDIGRGHAFRNKIWSELKNK